MTTDIREMKPEEQRQKLAKDTAEFLAKGGQIKELPYGPDGFNSYDTLEKLEMARRHSARIKATQSPAWNKATDPKFNNQSVTTAEQSRRAKGRANRFRKSEAA
ncbi:MAG: hypothetical protein MK185_04805 [Saccharospirillaceae bacterium]|nr:hypothetical protein [Saccharospirillaceae bacterium]